MNFRPDLAVRDRRLCTSFFHYLYSFQRVPHYMMEVVFMNPQKILTPRSSICAAMTGRFPLLSTLILRKSSADLLKPTPLLEIIRGRCRMLVALIVDLKFASISGILPNFSDPRRAASISILSPTIWASMTNPMCPMVAMRSGLRRPSDVRIHDSH